MKRKFLLILYFHFFSLFVFSQAPNVSFETQTEKVCLGSEILFENKTIPGNSPIDKSLWDFGDGIIVTIDGNSSIKHTYSLLGSFTVELFVTSKNGLSGKKRIVKYIEVIPVPTIDFELVGDKCHLPSKIKPVDKSLNASNFTYTWDFGNNVKSNLNKPDSVLYAIEDTFTVKLQLKNSKISCNNTLSKTKQISIYDLKGKIIGENIFCEREMKKLTTQSNYSIDNYTWYVANGSIEKNKDTGFVTMYNSGKATIKVDVFSKKINCQSTYSFPITIKPSPNPTFTSTKNIACPGTQIQFTETSAKNLGYTNFKWNFGDNTTFIGETPPVKKYEDYGDYSVSLICIGPNGCSGSVQYTNFIKIVGEKPEFKVDKSTICPGGKVQFSVVDDSLTECVWDFGDGTNFIGTTPPSHVYTKDSSYTVSLTCKMPNGCKGKNVKQNFIVAKGLKPDFQATNTIICPGMGTNFTVSDSISTCQWSFGDGSVSQDKNPSHTYIKEGGYDVNLKVIYKNGCSGNQSKVKMIKVVQPSPFIHSNVNEGCEDLPVIFSDSSVNQVKNDPFVSWEWDFGNGIKSDKKNPSVQLYKSGVYDVKLSVKSKNGCVKDSMFKQYIRVGKIENVDFSNTPTSACNNLDVKFNQEVNIQTPHQSEEVLYKWDFGDGGEKSTQTNPSHSYNDGIGFYNVKLIVKFRGCTDSMIHQKAVEIKPSKANFQVQQLYCNPNSLPIKVNVKDKSLSNQTDNVQVNWDFGDGTSTLLNSVNLSDTNLASTSHSYTDYGTYKIKQTITNQTTGCVDTLSKNIYVSWIKPDILIDRDSVCKLSDLKLSNLSTSFILHPVTSCTYLMGDGKKVVGTTPTYAYQTAGDFSIVGVPINAVGCFDTTKIASSLKVLALPVISLSADKKITCKDKRIHFGNNSHAVNGGIPLKSFIWKYSNCAIVDTTYNLSDSVSMDYFVLGDYYTSLEATDHFGCRSKDSIKVQIIQPSADFSMQNFVCNNQKFNAFINKQNKKGVNSWILDDNLINMGDTLQYSFQEPSNQLYTSHRVVLAVVDSLSCTNKKETIIKVSHPQAGISYSLSSPLSNNINDLGEYKCPPITSSFVNSTKSIGKVDSSKWTFWIGKTSGLFAPQVNYFFPGKYTVTLAVVDEFGCKSDTTISDFLSILGPQGVPVVTKKDSTCGQTFSFHLKDMENVSGVNWYLNDKLVIHDSIHFNYSFNGNSVYSPYVILTDTMGCNVTYYTDSIIVPDLGIVSKIEVDKKTHKLGENVHFYDESSSKFGISKWVWDLDGYTSSYTNYQSSIQKQFDKSGEKIIRLKVINSKGCFDESNETINIENECDIPNVITPNGDGVNDNFTLFNQLFKSYNVTIFNRWGVVIYKGENKSGLVIWDGKNENNKVYDDGVYFYEIDGELLDGSFFKKKGNISLIGSNK